MVTVSLQEAKEGSDSGKYEGYKNYEDKSYEEEMPSENKNSYMIDFVTSPAGTIKNQIEQEWEDSGEPFVATETRTEKVTVRFVNSRTEEITLGCNESITVNTYIDRNGKESKPKTFTNTCTKEKHSKHKEKTFTYTVKYEDTKKEKKTFKVNITGTIWRNIPRYVGSPDTSQITGNQYYRDYIKNYVTYAPDSVLTSFNFKDAKNRTGKTEAELLELLEREPFGGVNSSTSSSSSSASLDSLEIGGGAVSDTTKRALQYLDSFEKYGNMYGIDPYLMIQIAIKESNANHEGSLGNCDHAGCGIMQIEAPGNIIKSATAYNYETGQEEVMQVTRSNATDLDTNIKIGTMLMANRMKKNNYNILMGLQSYNFGASFEKHVLPAYLNATGKKLEDVQNDMSDVGWLDYVMDFHMHPNKYLGGTWHNNVVCRIPECLEYNQGFNHYGSPAYVKRFLKDYFSPNNEMWVMKEDGTKVSLATDGTVSFTAGSSSGSGSGSSGGVSSNWITKLWQKFKDNWQSLFPDLPAELAKERTEFSNKIPENQVDTIIKMMFVMEEQKYITDYDDFTDETWKEKFSLLFSNPVGSSWGSSSSSTSTVEVNQYFPNGFDLPLDLSPLTIKKEYSVDHMGIDLVAPKGTMVKAVADGEVTEIENSSSKGGKYIRIKHENGVYTLYGNVESISVSVGDKVTRGEAIGKTGNGNSEGNVLHFELSKNEDKEDPTWMVTGFFNASDYNMTEEDSQIINQIIALAKSKIGCRYTQESGSRNGPDSFDCSGFVNWLYKQTTGVSIGGWTGEQKNVLKNYRVSMDDLQPGDVIFGPGHVVLYIGNGRIIHASNSKPYPQGGVKEGNLYSSLTEAYRPLAYIKKQK